MLEVVDHFHDQAKANMSVINTDQYARWLVGVEGIKVLAKAGGLPFDLISQSWELRPPTFVRDLIAALSIC